MERTTYPRTQKTSTGTSTGISAGTPAEASAPASRPRRAGTPRRVVLVTGTGSGIGRASARAFAAEGALVVAVGRRAAPLEETAAGEWEREAGGAIEPYAADITADGAPERIVRHTADTYGRLDVLVNNAGIVGAGTLGTYTGELLAPLLATNLVAPVLLAQEAVPHLERTGGVLVNITTSLGQRGRPGNSVYAATKAGLELLTRSWAVELAPRGVRVVAIAPGAIETPIAEHRGLTPAQRTAVREWQIAHTPMGR
ncbi:SDR family NAD(P)-dependent oxidoreductase [Streptomyces sp. NPDC093589]|uniref:SDR family NAD(P)-dependent oxidoreductase n=1 Tax=Streptomyces sp. NPDC093589 TaxID=3366043 RepID=UPI00381D6FEC